MASLIKIELLPSYKDRISIIDKLGGQVKLTNQFTFKKNKLVKDLNPKDMRKKIVKSDRVTYNTKRVSKGQEGLKFASYLTVETPSVDISEYQPLLYYTEPLKQYTIKERPSNEVEEVQEILLNTTPVNYVTPNFTAVPILLTQVSLPTLTISKDYKSMSLLLLIDLEHLPIRITSSHRPGAKTRQGRTSYHSLSDKYGNSLAYDILPLINGKVDKSNSGFQSMQLAIINNPNAREWFKQHGFGIYDETSAQVMKKTGATGKHYHIGPDRVAKLGMNLILSKYGLDLIAYGANGLKFASYLSIPMDSEDISDLYTPTYSPYEYLSSYNSEPEVLYVDKHSEAPKKSEEVEVVEERLPVTYKVGEFKPTFNLTSKMPEENKTTSKYDGRLGYIQFVNQLNKYMPNADDHLKNWMIYTAANESNFNFDSKNKRSSAKGVFQITDGTWKGAGGKDRDSILEQFKVAEKLYNSYLPLARLADKSGWLDKNGYTFDGAIRALHYIGSGNFSDLIKGKSLRSPKGVDSKLLKNILEGKDYK